MVTSIAFPDKPALRGYSLCQGGATAIFKFRKSETRKLERKRKDSDFESRSSRTAGEEGNHASGHRGTGRYGPRPRHGFAARGDAGGGPDRSRDLGRKRRRDLPRRRRPVGGARRRGGGDAPRLCPRSQAGVALL